MNVTDVVLIGVVATAVADLWQQALKRCAGLPAADWSLIGRWVGWMPRGVLIHQSIANAAPLARETAIGWTFHYAIGIAYAGLYLAVLKLLPETVPVLASALAFGLVTVAAPWFLMQPALGFGIMARNLPNRRQVLLVTITTHLTFGLGLYAGLLLGA